jgi:hypothetical protein
LGQNITKEKSGQILKHFIGRDGGTVGESHYRTNSEEGVLKTGM